MGTILEVGPIKNHFQAPYYCNNIASQFIIHHRYDSTAFASEFLANIEEMFPRDIPIDNCMKEGNMSSLRSVAYRHMIVYNLS